MYCYTVTHIWNHRNEPISCSGISYGVAYYKCKSLNANPGKTQVCAFHLNNHQAKRKLNIFWNDERLKHEDFPVYLGVTLDRTLSFAEHVRKLKSKVATRNNLLGKLANSNWGTDPKTLRTTALAQSYSTAEYCSAAWARSYHAHTIDPELNNSCRIIIGTFKPTPLPALYRLAGIAPPNICRDIHARTQKYSQENDMRHPLIGHSDSVKRLKSRKSFMTIDSLDPEESASHRLEKWREWDYCPPNGAVQSSNEQLPSGTNLPRKDWVTLNRARTRVGKTGSNNYKWGLSPTSECPCGHPIQTMDHILLDCELTMIMPIISFNIKKWKHTSFDNLLNFLNAHRNQSLKRFVDIGHASLANEIWKLLKTNQAWQ